MKEGFQNFRKKVNLQRSYFNLGIHASFVFYGFSILHILGRESQSLFGMFRALRGLNRTLHCLRLVRPAFHQEQEKWK